MRQKISVTSIGAYGFPGVRTQTSQVLNMKDNKLDKKLSGSFEERGFLQPTRNVTQGEMKDFRDNIFENSKELKRIKLKAM